MANNTQRPGAVERFILDQTAAEVREGLPTPIKIDNFTAQVQASQAAPTLNGTIPQTVSFTWSQTGTAAPVINSMIIDDKNIGIGNITPARGAAGSYTFTFSPAGLFPFGGDFTFVSNGADSTKRHVIGRSSDDAIFLENRNDNAGANQDTVSQYARTTIYFWS